MLFSLIIVFHSIVTKSKAVLKPGILRITIHQHLVGYQLFFFSKKVYLI